MNTPSSLLPEGADAWLRTLASPRTANNYRAALRVLQQFGEATHRTPTNTPLPRAGEKLLPAFERWLKKQAAYSQATQRFYLAVARRWQGPADKQFVALPEGSDDFLRAKSTRSARTGLSYRTALRALQQFAEETGLTDSSIPLPLSQAHDEILADHYEWLRGREYSDPTRNSYLTTARLFYKWQDGARPRHLPANVSAVAMEARLEHRYGTRPEYSTPRLPEDRIGQLLGYYREALAGLNPQMRGYKHKRLLYLRNHAILLTLYSTAGRVSEVAQLKRRHAGHEFARVVGKGKKARELFLTQDARKAIQDYLNLRGDDSASDLFISHGRQVGRALSTSQIWRIVEDASRHKFGEKAGKPNVPVRPHDFRHLRAQHLLDSGMPLEDLQALLGHKSPATTRTIYAPRTPRAKLKDQLQRYGASVTDVVGSARTGKPPTTA